MKITLSETESHDFEDPVLRSAVRLACFELAEVHHVRGEQLASLFQIIAQAIMKNYNDGNCDASILGEQAISNALVSIGRKPH